MNSHYFSDREKGPRPRTGETIDHVVWDAIAAIVQSLVADGSFGVAFPWVCPDGSGVVGTNDGQWLAVLKVEHPDIEWPCRSDVTPATLAVLDLIEFTYHNVGKPEPRHYHEHFHHNHLTFDKNAGRAEFRQRINQLFARSGLAYELGSDGMVVRLAPTILRETLQTTTFQTGDSTLNSMLESARLKFLNPDPQVRREALEKLWDAWERIKTIEVGADKKAQVRMLLDKAAPEASFRALIEREARELTEIGNNFLIRHSETDRTPIGTDQHVDYLFHRLFAMMWMILNTRGT